MSSPRGKRKAAVQGGRTKGRETGHLASPSLESLWSKKKEAESTRSDGEDHHAAADDDEDLDARFARELARKEGIDVDALRMIERDEALARRLGGQANDQEEVGVSTTLRNVKEAPRPPPPPPPAEPIAVDDVKAEADPPPFDTDITLFDPCQLDTSTWPNGRAPYAFLVHAFVLISATRSRLKITEILTNMLRAIIWNDPDSLLPTIWLTANAIAPAYQGVELGIGGQVISKAIKSVSGISPGQMKALWDKWGDPGDVAFEAKVNVRTLMRPNPILIHQFYAALVKMSGMKGQGQTEAKTALVHKFLVAARGEEVRYFVRTLISHLRIGAVKLTLTASLARAFVLTRPRNRPDDLPELTCTEAELKGQDKAGVKRKLEAAQKLLRQVYAQHPNYNDIVPALLAGGLGEIAERCELSVGVPILPMLGSITRDLSQMHAKLENRPFVAEMKYDGQRVQIHVGDFGRQIKLYSRHLEDMTEKYPDIISLIAEMVHEQKGSDDDRLSVDSFIIDAEIVAIDTETGALQSFQTLSNRSRKDVKIEDVKVRVGVYAFDLMFLNGRSLLKESLRSRRALLFQHIPPILPSDPRIARFSYVACCESNEPDDIKQFFELATKNKCEGIMVKVLDHHIIQGNAEDDDDEGNLAEQETSLAASLSTEGPKSRRKALLASYEPDKRGESWLKVKRDYVEGVGDSLDLVPIGAWHGQGRKAGWWSPILLALHDPTSGTYQAVCKCISGFTDQFYKDLLVRYPDPKKGDEQAENPATGKTVSGSIYRPYYDSTLIPDVWFDPPREVWEIRGADITISPVACAARGLVHEDKGLSFRFPRFIRLRDDKSLEEATTSEQFADMYWKQQGEGHAATREEDEEEE